MKRLLLTLALLTAPLMAQDQKKEEAPKEPQVQKLFVLKYADPQQMAGLIRVFTSSVTPNNSMHALAVSAGKEAMAAIEDAITRLDAPTAAPRDIDLTVWLVVGGSGEPGTESGRAAPLPKDLDSVVTQLRNTFAYKAYGLQDVLTLRTRTGQRVESSRSSGNYKAGDLYLPGVTTFSVSSATVGADGTIRIDGLRAVKRVPYASHSLNQAGNAMVSQTNYMDVGVSADVDIKEGQKVVVGKSGLDQNEAMFVVLSARVAQ